MLPILRRLGEVIAYVLLIGLFITGPYYLAKSVLPIDYWAIDIPLVLWFDGILLVIGGVAAIFVIIIVIQYIFTGNTPRY